MHPRPPSPAMTLILTSSMNFIGYLKSIIALSQTKKSPEQGLFGRAAKPLLRQHADSLSFLVEAVKVNHAIDLREQGEVSPHANVFTRMNARANLADDDISRAHGLTAENLHSAPLFLAVAPVAGTSSRFLVCHAKLLDLDCRDF